MWCPRAQHRCPGHGTFFGRHRVMFVSFLTRTDFGYEHLVSGSCRCRPVTMLWYEHLVSESCRCRPVTMLWYACNAHTEH